MASGISNHTLTNICNFFQLYTIGFIQIPVIYRLFVLQLNRKFVVKFAFTHNPQCLDFTVIGVNISNLALGLIENLQM